MFGKYYGWTCLVAVGLSSGASAITIGQVDDFQDGTTMGWQEGTPSPNQPTNLSDGGPLGAGDHALRNISSGGFGPGSRLAMFNLSQWTGDYTAGVGVGSISGVMRADPGGGALLMRLAIEGASGERWGSTTAFSLPNDGSYHYFEFPLTSAALTQLEGSDPLAMVLSNVTQLRFLHSTSPDWEAGSIVATLDLDNLTANPIPEPSTTALAGIAALSLFVLRRNRLKETV